MHFFSVKLTFNLQCILYTGPIVWSCSHYHMINKKTMQKESLKLINWYFIKIVKATTNESSLWSRIAIMLQRVISVFLRVMSGLVEK